MTGKDNILEELRLISGFLATLSRVTPYGLPDGYFDGLAGQVLDQIRDHEAVLSSGLKPAQQPNSLVSDNQGSVYSEADSLGPDNQKSVYSVPEGYFEGFAGNLMSRIKAGQQTGALPDKPLATEEDSLQSSRSMPDFTPPSQPIPDFASSQEELESLSPFLSRIDKEMPFAVPQGYFEELSATVATNLASGAVATDLASATVATNLANDPSSQEVLSPLLAGLKNKQVYQAPQSYFDSFPDTVLAAVKKQAFDIPAVSEKQSAPAKVISLGVRRNWWKYSAAAAVVGLVLTGGWLWTHTSVATGTGNIDITNSLPKVSDQEIESYLDTNNVPVLDAVANSTASLDDLTDNDIKNFLGDVPGVELEEYIDENGDAKNLSTN